MLRGKTFFVALHNFIIVLQKFTLRLQMMTGLRNYGS